jgi:YfiH family protein
MRRHGDRLLTPERHAFAETAGIEPERIAYMGAVHGAAIARVEEPGLYDGVDGLVTDRPRVALFATYADCYPILVIDPKRRALGLAHAGWRGTRAGVVGALVDGLRHHFGSQPEALIAGVGPGICGRCYDVGEEVANRFQSEVRAPAREGRWLLDLAEANRAQLVDAGVQPTQIHLHEACTKETPYLPSHRRSPDGARFGCLLALR